MKIEISEVFVIHNDSITTEPTLAQVGIAALEPGTTPRSNSTLPSRNRIVRHNTLLRFITVVFAKKYLF
ncbi:MAG: hypothetical protein ACXWIU_05090 [Limisphaerales bacterium]